VPSALPNASPSNGGGEGAPKCSSGVLDSERLVLPGPLALLYAKDERLDDPGVGLLVVFLPKELVTPNDAGGGDDAVPRPNPPIPAGREDKEGGDPHAPIPGSTTPSAAERGVNPGCGVRTGVGSSYEDKGGESDIDLEDAFPRPSALSSYQAGNVRGGWSSS
jgi:hypothetical protein